LIHTVKTYITESVSPYRNLAVEEYLLDRVEPGERILYLWQNENTVVIGRNQNAYKECNTEKLFRDGGAVVRRLSGGGGVYHDMGNLNFTFFASEVDYDVSRQLSVIVKALEFFGLHAEKTGRNDICLDGRKFSGNAFYKTKGRCYHHGTILISADMAKMSEYLTVSAGKLNSKGVSSVKSRVINLKELNPEIDVPGIRAALTKAFGEVYGAKPQEMPIDSLDEKIISGLQEKYASNEWIYGRHMKADYVFGERFSWGEIEFHLKIQADKIIDAQIFSDSMNAGISEALARRLTGAAFRREQMQDAIRGAEEEIDPELLNDIYLLIEGQEIWQG
jgi:lipoate-protein ligase A